MKLSLDKEFTKMFKKSFDMIGIKDQSNEKNNEIKTNASKNTTKICGQLEKKIED